MAVCMQEDAEIGLERLIDAFRRQLSGPAEFNAFREFTDHAPLCFCTQSPMMWQQHVPEEVDALPVLADCDFSRMEVEMQVILEKSADGWQEGFQSFTALRHYYEVIGVSDIVPDLKCVLDELIEFVEVDVGEKLRCEVPDGDAGVPEECGVPCRKAPDDRAQQGDGFFILQTLFEDAEQDAVIDGREELMNIALEDEARPCAVAAYAPQHLFQRVHRLVRSLALSAGEGVSNERRLEERVKHGEYHMMQDAILHRSFVDAALLGITDGEGAVWLMPIGSSDQLPMQAKKVLLQMPLEIFHILPFLLSLAKLLPGSEEIFLGSDPPKKMPEYLH